MRASLENAKHLILDGDRLLAEGENRLSPEERSTAADLDYLDAVALFELARNQYVAGAVEIQRAEVGADSLPATTHAELVVDQLHGHLAAEFRAAREEVKRAPKGAAQDSAMLAQAFAENVRDRFARARPDLFSEVKDTSDRLAAKRSWSR
jgi:hypothetical protein